LYPSEASTISINDDGYDEHIHRYSPNKLNSKYQSEQGLQCTLISGFWSNWRGRAGSSNQTRTRARTPTVNDRCWKVIHVVQPIEVLEDSRNFKLFHFHMLKTVNDWHCGHDSTHGNIAHGDYRYVRVHLQYNAGSCIGTWMSRRRR